MLGLLQAAGARCGGEELGEAPGKGGRPQEGVQG